MIDAATLSRPSVTHEDALAMARALAAEIAPLADEAESLRRMPAKVIDAMMASGLMPLVRPAHYGGYALDWQTFTEALAPIGQVSGSMAWCIGFLLHHQWILSYFPQSVQDEVYSTHKDPKIVDSFAPGGTVTKVEGGYRISGEWAFGSGGDHCDWAITGVAMPKGDGTTMPGWAMFKPGQFWMRDTWHSIGLKASGSNNIVVEDAFVEDAYMLPAPLAMMGMSPGRPDIKGPMFETGVAPQFQFGLCGPLLAVTRGLYDSFISFTADKVGAISQSRKAEDPLLQLVVGESAAEIEAAHMIIRCNNDLVMAGKRKGSMMAAAEFIRDVGLIAKMTLTASDRLHNASGGRGLADSNIFGRHWRDVHAMTNHVALQYRANFKNFGATVLVGPQFPRK